METFFQFQFKHGMHAVLELKLEKGLHDLYTVFQRPDDHEGNKEWGAYYVYVDYQGE